MSFKNKEELLEFIRQGNKVEYIFFWGHRKPGTGVSKSCLSQWFESPFENNGMQYRTAEHYMMFEKAMLFGDSITAENIISSETPKEAQKFGRKVSYFNPSIWDKHKFDIVVKGNILKFNQNPEIGSFLKETKNKILVEASPNDRIWGIGLAASHHSVSNATLWQGSNLLGFALMKARRVLLEK